MNIEEKMKIEQHLLQIYNKNLLSMGNFLLKRIFHDVSGALNQVYLILGSRIKYSDFKEERKFLDFDRRKENTENYNQELQRILNSIVVLRDILINLQNEASFFASEEDIFYYITEICKNKNIDFIRPLGNFRFAFSNKEMLQLLFFATEIFPQAIEIMPSSIKISMKRDVQVHADFIKIIQDYEKNPGYLIEKLEKNVVTYKNIFLALFLNNLFENKKSLALWRVGSSDIFLSIKEVSSADVETHYNTVIGSESLLSHQYISYDKNTKTT